MCKYHIKLASVAFVAFCGVFFTCSVSLGQAAMRLELNQKRYLRFEQVFAKVTIRNYSPRAVAFSDSKGFDGELEFIIEKPGQGFLIKRTAEKIPIEGTVIKLGQKVELSFNLSKYYRIFDVGSYRVKAKLSHPQWPKKYKSNSESFNVEEGLTVFERIFGVLDPNNPNKDSSRKYIIKSAYNGKNKVFYLVVEDDYMIYRVVPIGYDVGVDINCEVDGLNYLHVLMQANPRIFAYMKFDINGKRVLKEVYTKEKVTPNFYRNPKNGQVSVVGGKKAIEGLHYKPDDGTLFGRGGSNIAPATEPTTQKAPVVEQ